MLEVVDVETCFYPKRVTLSPLETIPGLSNITTYKTESFVQKCHALFLLNSYRNEVVTFVIVILERVVLAFAFVRSLTHSN